MDSNGGHGTNTIGTQGDEGCSQGDRCDMGYAAWMWRVVVFRNEHAATVRGGFPAKVLNGVWSLVVGDIFRA